MNGQTATVDRSGTTLFAVPDTGAIALVHWPDEAARVDLLRATGQPRLLLVAEHAPPPTNADLAEDWVRLPASPEDLNARTATLAARLSIAAPRPTAVGDGRLVHRGEWVALSPIEESIIAALVADFGEVVLLSTLARGADGHELTANAIRVHVMRLRKRIRPLGLVVRTVHGRGYLIEADHT